MQNNVVEAIKHVPPVTANHWRMALDLGFSLLPIGLKSETGLSRVCIPQNSGHPPSCATKAATSGTKKDADRRGRWTVRVRGRTWLGKQRGYKSRSGVAGSGLAKKRERGRAEGGRRSANRYYQQQLNIKTCRAVPIYAAVACKSCLALNCCDNW